MLMEISVEEIKRKLKTKVAGKKFYYFTTINSTNEFAKKLAEKGSDEEGAVVIAEKQTEGKGRLSRKWESPEGGIYMSILLMPKVSSEKLPALAMVSVLGTCRAINSLYPVKAGIKWPNDIFVREKKLAGILSEVDIKGKTITFVAGIGINANSEINVEVPTTSLKQETGREIDRNELIARVLGFFDEYYSTFTSERELKNLISEYKKLSVTLGRSVIVKTPKETMIGEAMDIESDGGLVIKLADGSLKRILAGDCLHLDFA